MPSLFLFWIPKVLSSVYQPYRQMYIIRDSYAYMLSSVILRILLIKIYISYAHKIIDVDLKVPFSQGSR